jgi:hypothetical protein
MISDNDDDDDIECYFVILMRNEPMLEMDILFTSCLSFTFNKSSNNQKTMDCSTTDNISNRFKHRSSSSFAYDGSK